MMGFVLQSIHLRCRPAFTLIEVVIVLAIFSIVMATTLPFLGKIQQEETVNTLTSDIQQTLMRARSRAMSGDRSLPWGIRFNVDSYVLYAGPSFENRNARFDELHHLNRNFLLSGTPEVTFLPLYGNASTEARIEVSHTNGETHVVTVNGVGMISSPQ